MRARWLKPEFFRDKRIGSMGLETALVYQALWVISDDYGTCLCAPYQLKADMFLWWPSMTLPKILESLGRLLGERRIRIFRVGDDVYSQILRWDKHQNVHHPGKFRHPTQGEELTAVSPETFGESPEAYGSPHHLDTYTPRHLDTQRTTSARPRKSRGTSGANGACAVPQPSWVADAAQLWRAKEGDVSEGRIGRALKRVVDLHSWETIRPALECYLSDSPADKARKPEWFAQRIVYWLTESQTPLVDRDGVLTARGERLMRAT